MRPRFKLPLLLLTCCVAIPSDAFILPLLFPVSIKITFHSNHKPTPPPKPSYHFEAVPVYREVVVKGSAHISPPKYSYGDGQKYGSSYGDGQIKVYTEEPHIRGHKYANGYGSSDTGGYIDGHFSISSQPVAPPTHYKGSPYDGDSGSHYKGGPYSQTDYKDGPYSQTDYKGGPYSQTDYKGQGDGGIEPGLVYIPDGDEPPPHHKGTPYGEKLPPATHDKGTPYDDNVHSTLYKGTAYEEEVPTHYKGSSYEDGPGTYKGSRPTYEYKKHSYIKQVGGGYKVSDYISDDKSASYPQEDEPYLAVPPGKTYAEIEAAHKAARGPKAYAADQYSDLGSKKYNKEYEHDASYIDDTLPAYKSNIPRPAYRSNKPRPAYRYQASASRYDRVLPSPTTEKKTYAGFGTSIYGDSYAKITYVPRALRISIRAFAHK